MANLVDTFGREFETDEECPIKSSERIKKTYEAADDTTKAAIDDISISLCGWSMETLIEKADQ